MRTVRTSLDTRASGDETRALREQIAKRERELAILSAVASRIHGVEEAEQILRIALDEILDRMELTTAWIFLGDAGDSPLRLGAQRGVSSAYLDNVERRGLDECLCPEVFSTGRTMQARNTLQCPRMPEIVAGLAEPVAHACVPLKFEGGQRGVLNVAARPGQQFAEEELRFFETLGHQICVAIERAHHLQSERRRNRQARALAAVSKAIGGSLDVSAVLRAVGETARELLGGERIVVLLGEDPAKLRVAYVSGTPHPELEPGRPLDLVAAGSSVARRSLEERRAFLVADVRTDARASRALAERWGVGSCMTVPLVVHDRVSGLVLVTRAAPRAWSEEELEVAEALAGQAALALDNARLYAEGRQAYEDLRNAQARIILNEKMAVLGTFASGLAHEVRNPLNSIGLQLSILERRTQALERPAVQRIREIIGIIREEIKRLDALVGDFLLLSRTSRLQFHPASLDVLADDVVRLLRPEAGASRIDLQCKRWGDPTPDISMDAEKMKQVIINLVRNAIEAMPDGGTVVVESGLVEGRACFRVSDTGPGLPDDVDVFQIFVSTKPGGTGLGLSIAQQIVLDHGGEITVSSEPGKGAAFTVRLPAGPPARSERV